MTWILKPITQWTLFYLCYITQLQNIITLSTIFILPWFLCPNIPFKSSFEPTRITSKIIRITKIWPKYWSMLTMNFIAIFHRFNVSGNFFWKITHKGIIMNFYMIFISQKLFLKIYFSRNIKSVKNCHKVQSEHTSVFRP